MLKMVKKRKDNQRVEQTLWSKRFSVVNLNEIENKLNETLADLAVKNHRFLSQGSGWVIESVNSQYLSISKYQLSGSSYIGALKELQDPKKKVK